MTPYPPAGPSSGSVESQTGVSGPSSVLRVAPAHARRTEVTDGSCVRKCGQSNGRERVRRVKLIPHGIKS